MGVKKVIKTGFLSGFNIKSWVGAEQIKSSTKSVKNLVEMANTQNGQTEFDSFEACMKHYQLTERDIPQKMKKCLLVSIFSFGLGIFAIIYLLFWLSHMRLIPAFVTAMLAFYLLANAYRQHFNYFQMKVRRLGCTFEQWVKFVTGRRGRA